MPSSAQAELAALERLAGCSGRSVSALEAAWPSDAPVPWSEAYRAAREQADKPAADQNEGRTVAWLEGALVMVRAGRD